MASRLAFQERRIGLQLGGRPVVEQHVEAGVKEIAPATDEMIEQSLLMIEQPVVTAIELVDLRQPGVLAQQIGHGAALKPFAMEAPLACWHRAASGASIANGLSAAPWPICWARTPGWRRSTSSIAVTTGCSIISRLCSIISSVAGAISLTPASTCCSTT